MHRGQAGSMSKIISILLALIAVTAAKDLCIDNYQMLGCYEEESPRYILFNDKYDVDWHDIVGYMKRLACKCAQKAHEKGFFGFALHYWGECYGKTEEQLQFLNEVEQQNDKCIGDQKYSSCNVSCHQHCVGKEFAEAVYAFKVNAEEDIDGGFSEWQEWTPCDKICGTGLQHRERTCDNPKPAGKGKDCRLIGDYTQSRACKLKDCPVDGGYGAWEPYSDCTKTCGGGVKTRRRQCNNPEPAYNGKDCSLKGPATESTSCNTHKCPVDGGYGAWGSYTECSVSCGGGSKRRNRLCNDPSPAYSGKNCTHLGPATESVHCNSHECPVNGGYGEWGEYSVCSKSCGGGTMSRNRLCNSPAPAFGGNDCSGIGPARETTQCNTHECPINGGYGEWGGYTSCTVTCGGGTKSRSRNCDNPQPAFGGKDCTGLGPDKESIKCNTHECPIDGGYGDWGEYSSCSVSCGGGSKTRRRKCNNPLPAFGGKDCSSLGSASETAQCNTQECPVDGGYSKWTEFGRCSVLCGGGTKARTRQCNSPSPAFGGKDCSKLGPDIQTTQCNTQECPVNGGYGPWGKYGSCSVTCGGGVKTRRRLCDDPKPAFGGNDCSALGPNTESAQCNTHECPVDGGYGPWGKYSACSVSCGGGIKTRKRKCNRPKPEHGGDDCSDLGPDTESAQCNTHECPIDGGYGEWGQYSDCSKSCGGGTKTRARKCDNPVPAFGGKDCESLGPATESTQCNTHECPVDGGYGDWSQYRACSVSCGGGLKTRSRLCDNPEPAFGGKDCSQLGPETESSRCNTHECPVHGAYGPWREYGSCSVTCGGGVKTRRRLCDDPKPAFGGKDCSELGPDTESAQCNTHECPVDGGYSPWGKYSACSVSCGGGIKTRKRKCNRPKPEHGGDDCSDLGPDTESAQCNTHECPIDGGYGEWGQYSDCSKYCGGGTKTRVRKCDNPVPAFGGKDCESLGPATESTQCNTHECPVDGGYGPWGEYDTCSALCGGGEKTRRRHCDDPKPAFGGNDCSALGPDTESAQCNTHECPVDGGYSPWGKYSACSVSCGGGIKTRKRKCNRPKPEHGGDDCSDLGPDTESAQCNTHECPIDGGYGEWGQYSDCSKSCGRGTKARARKCDNPVPAFGGKDCESLGPATESTQCNTHECPIDGGYGEWGQYSDCSKSCGGGTKTRARKCDNPVPAFGGKDCESLGPSTESTQCNTQECPVDGGYGPWGEYDSCSALCGGGEKTRRRHCDDPKPAFGGNDCSALGPDTESAQCNTHECPVDGGYSPWGKYSACSVSCGGGIKTRKRKCNRPKPEHGGDDCSDLGPDTESAQCNTHECPIDGGYGEWGQYSDCSKSCGGGIKTRVRKCDNPVPAFGGKDCESLGPATESTQCNTHECPVDGGYGPWGEYDTCSALCGGGEKTRRRHCDDPKPAFGGNDCSALGPDTESAQCNTHECPVDGGYSPWGKYSACSVSCGGGIKTRKRKCNRPKPEHGGDDCSDLGPDTESAQCNTHECPIDGGYGEWGQYSDCSKSCGGGTKTRARRCDNPVPAFGGKDCESLGATKESAQCNTHECPVDGGYSEWGQYSECSKFCGGGIKTRERNCDNPAPAFGGKDCDSLGPATESTQCNTHECQVDGGYGPWTEFSTCSNSCGGGKQTRTRACDNPVPAFGGKDCSGLGKDTETSSCNSQQCSVDGGYGQWGEFSSCSKSCGGGIKTKQRLCNNPTPANGGKDCSHLGPSTDTITCNTHACRTCSEFRLCSYFKRFCNNRLSHRFLKYKCPITCGFCKVNGDYGPWTTFAPCSRSCGGGTKARTRLCNNPPPMYGGENCEKHGPEKETVPCNLHECPVDGGYGPWEPYSACTRSCGGGTKSRNRTCNKPQPSIGGKDCSRLGPAMEIVSCNTQDCQGDRYTVGTNPCKSKYTVFQTHNSGDFTYLDRHRLTCEEKGVLSMFQLQRMMEEMRFEYKCCEVMKSSCNLKFKTTSFERASQGKLYDLTKHSVDCGLNGFIKDLKLETIRGLDQVRYRYQCCNVKDKSVNVSCYTDNTSYTDRGNGKVFYFDRQSVFCKPEYGLSFFHLEKNKDNTKIRYQYRCCTLNN